MSHHTSQAHARSSEHVETSNTGIDNRKLGFWIFLSSECIFFATLLVGYLVYNGKAGDPGPRPAELFNIPLTSISTFVLLMSSLAMVLAVSTAQRGLAKQARGWVIATAAMGVTFLGFQIFEFTTFVSEGLTLKSSLFGTSFYTLTGFHGAHVAVGVIWLLSLLYHGGKDGLGADKAADVEIGGLYWHFVDVVWIVIFTVVYLLEFAK